MYNKWDIVLVNFPFSNFNNFKIRPVLIWRKLWNDFIVMPITSNKSNIFWEYIIKTNSSNNLKVNSTLKVFNIFTIDGEIIKWRLWLLSNSELIEIKDIFCKKICNQDK